MDARPAEEFERPYNWSPRAKPGKRRSKARIAVLTACFLVTAFIVLVAYANREIHQPQNSDTKAFPFIVRSGDSYSTIADRLSKDGILHNSLLFQLDARIRSLGTHLRVGVYTLQPNMSIDQMISTLGSQPQLLQVLIPPGPASRTDRVDPGFVEYERHGLSVHGPARTSPLAGV